MALSLNLIFLHGWGTDSSVWKHQIDHFSGKHNVMAPNLIGPQSTVHSPLLSTVDCGPSTVLIGWSYGGMLAMELASKKPSEVKALVLAGCSAKFTQSFPDRADTKAGRAEFADGINPIIIKNIRRGLNRDFEGTMRNRYGAFFLTDEAIFMRDFIERQILPDRKMAIEMLDRLLVMDLRTILKDIAVPTLVVHGNRDEICPLGAGEYLHNNIRDSQFKIIKDTGHMPFYTRPEEFNRIMEDFIASIK